MKQTVPLSENQEILRTVDICLEEFVDDILPALRCKGFDIHTRLSKRDPNKLFIKWHWDHLAKAMEKEFVYSQTEPDHAFTDRVKAYFFDLTVMIINLQEGDGL